MTGSEISKKKDAERIQTALRVGIEPKYDQSGLRVAYYSCNEEALLAFARACEGRGPG